MSSSPRASVPLAMLWMSGALVSFSGMAIAGRELSTEVSLYEVLFLRSTVCLIVLLALLPKFGWRSLKTPRPGLHLLRNSVHYLASFCWYFGVVSIPLAEVFAIEFTSPIWTALLAAIFLREPLTRARIGAIALGFLGILVILRPGAEVVHIASLVVLIAAIGYGSAYVITKRLTVTDGPFVILFYMNAIQFLIGIGPTFADWVTPSVALWPWVVVVGLTGLTSHYCITRAMQHADAMVVAPLDFLRLPLIAVVGYFVYAETLDVFVLLGALLVVGGNFINLSGSRQPTRVVR